MFAMYLAIKDLRSVLGDHYISLDKTVFIDFLI